MTKSLQLKVKAKHLAEEAKIIRKEERKQLDYAKYLERSGRSDSEYARYLYNNLRNHRVGIVRHIARLTNVARAYLSGYAYSDVENKVHDINILTKSDLKSIARMTIRYGGKYELSTWAVTDYKVQERINELQTWIEMANSASNELELDVA